MTTRTPIEARQHYIEAMGDELGSQYAEMWQEMARLYSKWTEYIDLFGTKPTRVELLNEAASYFFGTIQNILWEDTLLHIARLTDAPRSAGRANLTVQNLPKMVKDDDLKARLISAIKEATDKAAFCRDWRNRRIAHADLDLAINEAASPLAVASRIQVNEALEALVNVLRLVSQNYLDSDVSFDMGSNPSGAMSLLHVLHDGVNVERRRREMIKQGKIPDIDCPGSI